MSLVLESLLACGLFWCCPGSIPLRVVLVDTVDTALYNVCVRISVRMSVCA
jgi:hypothetical protein